MLRGSRRLIRLVVVEGGRAPSAVLTAAPTLVRVAPAASRARWAYAGVAIACAGLTALPTVEAETVGSVPAFAGLSPSLKYAVLSASAVYPKSSSLSSKDVPACRASYSDVRGFRAACDEAKRNINVKALGAHVMLAAVLDAICPPFSEAKGEVADSSVFEDLGLDAVDALVIHRFGRLVVHLERTGGERNQDSRTLFIELNDVRQRSADIVKFYAAEAAALRAPASFHASGVVVPLFSAVAGAALWPIIARAFGAGAATAKP